jgi:hypothetical protein
MKGLDSYSLNSLIPPKYNCIPEEFVLDKAIVLHRHGDRGQISTSLGANYKVSENMREEYRIRLPSEHSKRLLRAVACISLNGELLDKSEELSVDEALYASWDAYRLPLAQLTQRGVMQLYALGNRLRSRYYSSLLASPPPLPNKSIHPFSSSISSRLYCRSTHYCRTLQSQRALLLGLLHNPDNLDTTLDTPDNLDHLSVEMIQSSHTSDRPVIITREECDENMYPEATHLHAKLIYHHHRILHQILELHHFEHIHHMIGDSEEELVLQDKLYRIFGYPSVERIEWQRVRETLVCHHVHNLCDTHALPRLSEITGEDVQRVNDIAARQWGVLFNDDENNQYAIGRFLRDLVCIIDNNNNEDINNEDINDAKNSGLNTDQRLFIFSVHDSTLVPLLSAMKSFDGKCYYCINNRRYYYDAYL